MDMNKRNSNIETMVAIENGIDTMEEKPLTGGQSSVDNGSTSNPVTNVQVYMKLACKTTVDNHSPTHPMTNAHVYKKLACKTTVDNHSPTYPMKKAQVYKNLAAISVSFLLVFTAFQSLQNLQSSLNPEEGLGTVGLSVLYATGIVAGLFLPTVVIDRLGCKWTMAASVVCYIVYMAANLHATWATIIPAAVIIGVGSAPLWAAHSTYLTQAAVWHAAMTQTTKDAVVNRFFGVFFMTFQTSQIWGNLISSLVFRRHENTTHADTTVSMETCGAAFCPVDYNNNNTNMDRPDMVKIYTVCGIYLGCAVVGVLVIVVALDQITLDRDRHVPAAARAKKHGISLHLLTDIVRHVWTSRYQQLLIPLTIYSGIEQAFVAGEFTQSYISCAVGIWNVGFVMIAFGVANAACSLVFGRLVKFVGHTPFFVLAFLVHGGTQIGLLVWRPTPDSVIVFYIVAILWGMGDAVITTQLNALYGCLFTEKTESAFATYRLCDFVGYILAFGLSSVLCTSVKLYICLAFLTLGMALYGAVELLERRREASDMQF